VEILVCVKRVPMVGGKIVLTADGQDVDTRMSGFTVSPHEECAVEEAVRLVERYGGGVTVLTLGPPAAADQLRDMLALGATRAVLLETDGREWGPIATADAIVAEVRAGARPRDPGGAPPGSAPAGNPGGALPGDPGGAPAGGPGGALPGNPGGALPGGPGGALPGDSAGAPAGDSAVPPAAGCPYDLLLFGNEAADTGDYQVGVRVAHALGLPCVTGIKHLEVTESGASARREYRGTEEVFDIPLPAVVSVKEGINLPRYPSLPGRLRAKRATIERREPPWRADGLAKAGLAVPAGEAKRAEILGTGADAVPALVALLDDLGILS
jgi:electron transfer flavoprotein alpha/beta subunit